MIRRFVASDAAGLIRRPGPHDDKYSRGVVGLRTGSLSYPGAAVLGVSGAWRSGAGLVRYVGDRECGMLVLHRRPETVLGPGRVGCWVIGSGTDPATRSDDEEGHLRVLLSGDTPVVVDAGALDLVDRPDAPTIITPHEREFDRLCQRLGIVLGASVSREDRVVAVAVRTGSIVLLKGVSTLIASPEGDIVSVESETSWLATAGTGDVLAGVIATLVAQHGANVAAVACAAWLHSRAAALAARGPDGSEHPLVALDVADALPAALSEVLVMHV